MLTDILEKIIAIFGSGNDNDAKKKRIIKDLKKDLKKNSKFYNTKKEEVTVQMAQFFYNIYKLVEPYNDVLENAPESKAFKSIIVEGFLSPEMLKDVEALSSESISKRLDESRDVKQAVAVIHKQIVSLVAGFSSELTEKINNTFNSILLFRELACYNYYFMLKKFDSRLPVKDMVYKPSFSDIKGSYVAEDLKDFLEVLYIFDIGLDWKDIFSVMQPYRPGLTMDLRSWTKVVKSIMDAKKNGALLNIVKVEEEDPFYEVKARFTPRYIVEDYINAIKDDADTILKTALKKRKQAAISKYIDQIFGDTHSIERNKYYTANTNITYEKKGIETYLYTDSINYLRAYYLDFFKTETKPVLEILLIQGQWSIGATNQEFSEAFHQIQTCLPKTIELDNALSDEGAVGKRIKNMLRKSGKDMIAKNALDTEVKNVNIQARAIIHNSLNYMITLGNIMKSILEEYKAGKVATITNWKDLQGANGKPLEEEVLNVYKKLYYMVQLIQQSIKDLKEQ